MAFDAPKMETPASQKSAASEPRIFTMPEKYRGLAATQKPSAPPAAAQAAPTPVPSAPKPPPLKPGVGPAKKKMPGSTKALLAAGVILIVGLAGAGVYVYLSLQPPKAREPEQITPKPPTEEPEAEKEKPEKEVKPEEPAEKETASPFPTELSPGRDTDSDGLTDLEEALYGTNTRLPDTDADGFLDGNEVFHRYNPRGAAPGTLLESGIVMSYTADEAYTIFYPTAWTPRVVEDQPGSVVFVAPSGETVTVSAEVKDASLSVADWYASANPGSDATTLGASTTKNGYAALVVEDQMTAYIDFGGMVVTVSYQVVVKSTIDFLQTFQMMVNSLSAP